MLLCYSSGKVFCLCEKGVQHLPDVFQLRGPGQLLQHSSTAVGGKRDKGQLLLHSSAAVVEEGDKGQVLLHSSAADAVIGGVGQGLRRGKVASSGCASQW